MYFEHDWTADGPHITRKQRADWQKKTAKIFNSYVDTLYNRSLKKLGGLIAKPAVNNSISVYKARHTKAYAFQYAARLFYHFH